jgi:16S rRNA C967 or C1407 C5-methylase (RsmB/RsmF family)/NOL1/NOP2/fmu family ribosome biogenesis protein
MMQLPHDFETYSAHLMGVERFGRLKEGLEAEATVSVRLNPWKCSKASHTVVDDDGEVPWCPLGHYLKGRPQFTFDPLFHAGAYYVQEASSMFLYHVLRQIVDQPVLMLDLCAAPGGKTTVSRSVLPEGSVVMSNEPVALRSNILAENVQKFGHPNCMVTRNYAADYARSGLMFDLIVADVPCSGEGMFRKDDTAVTAWSPELRDQCWKLQRSIIEDVWPCLRPGGMLVYSTCTFNDLEDEGNVDWICKELGAEYVRIEVPEDWNITGSLVGSQPVYRFLPGFTRGEGFFLTVLRKSGEGTPVMENLQEVSTPKRAKRHGKSKSAQEQDQQAMELLGKLDGDFVLRSEGEQWRAVPKNWSSIYDQAQRSLHLLHAGVELGMQRGRDIVPHAGLALSTALKETAFPKVDVDYFSALSYLRKEAVMLPSTTPKGVVLLCYEGHPLGFEKNMGNRANNLYPTEWRIKSTHLPESIVKIVERKEGE